MTTPRKITLVDTVKNGTHYTVTVEAKWIPFWVCVVALLAWVLS